MRIHCARFTRVVFILVGVLLLTQAASAQDAGIAGGVTDDTGGVLPGVTVTAASPALIEQQRIAISNGEGRYAFTQLSVGTYSVTFSLPGFNQVLREGIELTSGFTANVNAELGVGGIEDRDEGVGDDLGGALEPELRGASEHRALPRDAVRHDHVEGRNAVGGDEQQAVVVECIDIAHLAAVQPLEVERRLHHHRRGDGHERAPATSAKPRRSKDSSTWAR